jgi:protease-4
VSREAYARGETAQLASAAKPWTEKERLAVERQIDGFYRLFVDRVAEGRHLARADVEAAASGRVWTGRQALERGLVDRLGSLEDALAIASERAGLPRGDVKIRRAGRARVDGALAGALARNAETPVTRALGSVPEVRALFLLAEIGPVVALPVEWVVPTP